LVFDIGQVLVRLRPQPLLSLFAAHGYVPQGLPDVVARVGLHEYEAGRFDGEELLSRLIALAPQPPPRAAVRAAWLDLFEPIEAMLEFARRARGPYRTFLLSNVGDLHWLELDRAYGLHTLTDAICRPTRPGSSNRNSKLRVGRATFCARACGDGVHRRSRR
jgi:FMN phosphatase YigB (HAD superfamily)